MSQNIAKIRQASRQMIRELGMLNNQFSDIGSVSQCHALLELEKHKMLTAHQLSDLLNLEKSSTSRLLKELLNKSYCIEKIDPYDNRNKFLSLSKKGTRAIDSLNQLADKQVENAIANLKTDEKQLVVKGMLLYGKALQKSRLDQQVQIRPLLKRDIAKLTKITRYVWAEFGFDADHPDAKIYEKELRTLFDTFNLPGSGYFILSIDNKVVGGGGYAPCPSKTNTCELKNMYFLPEVRGMGLGARLLEFTLHQAKADNYQKCYLETMHFMNHANSLYQKCGFKKLSKPLVKTTHTWTTNWYIKALTK